MRPLKTGEAQGDVDVTLYDRLAPTIFTYLRQQVTSQQDAEDLLLEVFSAVLNKQELSDLPEAQQLAWLRRVARNKVIDRYRRNALRTELPLEQAVEMEDGQLTPEAYAVQQESYERLHLALEQLSPQQQQLIQLRYGNGLRLVEIAGMLEKPEGTVRKMLFRTLRRLRAIYDTIERGTH